MAPLRDAVRLINGKGRYSLSLVRFLEKQPDFQQVCKACNSNADHACLQIAK